MKSQAVAIIKNHRIKNQDVNLIREERKTITKLSKDKDIMILPADKARATVVIDKEQHHRKVMELLDDYKTFIKLHKDPTSEYKEQLKKRLKQMQNINVITKQHYLHLIPPGDNPSRLYGSSKIHKEDCPLRPKADNIGTVFYHTAEILANILKPMVGNAEYHCRNSSHYTEDIKNVRIKDN